MAADTFLTHDMLAERTLFDLENELAFSKNVYRGYNSEVEETVKGFKKGGTVRVQLPNKYRTKSGATMDAVGIQERNVTITVDEHRHVAVDILESDLTLNIADLSKKILRPASIALANYVDAQGCKEYKNVYNQVGTPGTTPSTFSVLADAALRLDQEGIVREGRVCVFSPKAHWAMADGELKTVFQQKIVDTMLRKGFIGNFALFDMYMDPNIQTHTVGAHGGTPVMNGATAEAATALVTDGWSASAAVLKQGDIFTVAAVYGVNPVSGDVWEGNELRQFVCTADETSVSDALSIAIAPTIYSSAASEDVLPYQTIGTLPANEGAITVVGTASSAYPVNLAFHPHAFALTCVPFRRPMSAGESVMWGQASDKQLGLSITVSTGFDVSSYLENSRMDILFGWDTPQPEYAVRIAG